MADELFAVLSRFHREVVLPDLEERFQRRDESEAFQREVLSHFDEIYRRFDRLESEYQSLAASFARLEKRGLTRLEFQQELEVLSARVKDLEQGLARLRTDS